MGINSVLNVFIELNQVMFVQSLRNWPSMSTNRMHTSSLTMKYNQHDRCCFFSNELFIKADGLLILLNTWLCETCV